MRRLPPYAHPGQAWVESFARTPVRVPASRASGTLQNAYNGSAAAFPAVRLALPITSAEANTPRSAHQEINETRNIVPAAFASASDLTGHLYAALTLAERASYLREAGKGWIGSKADASRAAATLDRWKSQKPFPAGDSFEKRLRLDGLTEEDLLAILGLPPEVYPELIASPLDWVRELERISSPRTPWTMIQSFCATPRKEQTASCGSLTLSYKKGCAGFARERAGFRWRVFWSIRLRRSGWSCRTCSRRSNGRWTCRWCSS